MKYFKYSFVLVLSKMTPIIFDIVLDFLEGNIIKYVSRYPHKGGVNDLLKARTYLEKLIKREVEKT